MTNAQQSDYDFSSLSLKDLIEARDLYHFHLMSKANVIGTAVGLYLIRKEEEWPNRERRTAPKLTTPRTFENSEVRDYSWPCIIVLVRKWLKEEDAGKTDGPSVWDFLPKRLYLPDGRAVPACIVWSPAETPTTGLPPIPKPWPQATFGGGLPLYSTVQYQEHMATIGCLVSDGHTTYALTARHACGEPGTEVSAMLRHGLEPIGVSSPKQITRLLFSEVYPALPMRQTWLGLDVGLVRLHDVRSWTHNIYRFPKMQPLQDVYEQSISLRKFVDQTVVALGAASGVMTGTIKAMFYRYRSVGGYDYVSDFLIAPAAGEPGAKHGDSGALWHLQKPGPDGKPDTRPLYDRNLRPLAIEWGSQVLSDAEKRSTFSVATSLSNVCKILDVELVVDAPTDVSGTWGLVGHYSIGTIAIGLVKNEKLKAFLEANADLMSMPLASLGETTTQKALIDSGFVPLADVPDVVWKKFPSPHLNRNGEDKGVVGGRDTKSTGTGSTGPEHANHHCDADMPFDGKDTLVEACLDNPDLLTAANWNAYFDTFPENVDVIHRGILPFRVWQYFERLKEYAANEPAKFIAAAGTLAHYIGDSSQPLHGSIYSDGIKDKKPDVPRSERKNKDGQPIPAHRGEGIHSDYESGMIDWAAKNNVLFAEIAEFLGDDHAMDFVPDGRSAALATLACMRDVAKVLPPQELIDGYEKVRASGLPKARTLWAKFGPQTGEVMAIGACTLAMLWDSAWAAGGGDTDHGPMDPDKVRALYENPTFVKSVTIKEIEREIREDSFQP